MDAPFVKVEATKFTEVGYVGRDVDSMVRDLVEASIRITKQSQLDEKYAIADEIVEDRIIEAIIPGKKKPVNEPNTNRNPFEMCIRDRSITPRKLGNMKAAACGYLAAARGQKRLFGQIQFDAIEIEINHIENI